MKIFVIGLCIGLLLGNFIGVVLMGLMVAASNEDRSRDNNALIKELDKVYNSLNDHMLAVAPDETTPDSEYDLRKGIAIGVQQSLNSLVHLWKPEEEVVDEYSKIMFKGICPYTSKECEKWTCYTCEVEKAERKLVDEG